MARRAGYVVAAIINGVLVWVANSLLGWGWPAFLTDAFDDLLPWVELSLAATIAMNLVWVWRDPEWSRHAGQLVLDVIGVVVVVRSWQIFPLDFAGYWSGWETLARVALAVAFFGMILDTFFRLVSLARIGAERVDHDGGHRRAARGGRGRLWTG